MSDFEKVVRAFMAERGVGTLRELHARMADAGHDVDFGRLQRTITGDWSLRARPQHVNRAIANALDLTEEQKTRMALAALPGLFAA